ncbi:hypothetical protein [Spirulina subsalsa]|uniref:hypothetical protein n=1 Tax=Spirulina subsalsa TaxID=54311 RepID=UPI00036C9360|nr:hypothetical protein [Spirulina subsalsa]
MLTHHRRPVCLSLISTDLPLWSMLETAATLYQKDQERFHIILKQPPFPSSAPSETLPSSPFAPDPVKKEGLLWLELSPYRVIMTMQGNGQLGYRHFWEQGVYGTSRYWLYGDSIGSTSALRLRNYTRSLHLVGYPLPHTLRIEYELWAEHLQMGHYILSLEIHH